MFKKVFIDANIFLDTFDPDRHDYENSFKTYEYLLKHEKSSIYTSCDLITTIYYINSQKNKKQALLNIQSINQTLKIIEFSNNEIEQTCDLMLHDSDYKDLEDTIQYIMAKKYECDLIISNDKKFISKDIELVSSKEFFEKYIK
jgi:predicted nucleic acid-binding protein